MNKIAAELLLGISTVFVCRDLDGIELDPTFGNAGRVLTEIGRGDDLRGLAVHPDGRIVVVGNHEVHILMGFYTANGRPDPAVGTAGLLPIFHGSIDAAGSIALQPDGKIVVGGYTQGPPESGGMVFRLLPNGTPDPSFDGDGFVIADAGIAGVAIQPDGKVVAGGTRSSNGVIEFVAFRYLEDGTPDGSFGSGGVAALAAGAHLATGMVLDDAGRVVLGGVDSPGRALLVRFLPDGSPDPDFGSGGAVTTAIGNLTYFHGLAVGRDGAIVAVGESQHPNHLVVARYRSDGSLDPSFGAGTGLVLGDPEIRGNAVAVDGANRVVVVGRHFGDFILARYLPNGEPDRSVGPDGWVSGGLGNGYPHAAEATALKTLRDGSILVAGYQQNRTVASTTAFALIRYGSASTPIPTLSGIGRALFAGLIALVGWVAIKRVA